ncbi:trypsin delta [Zeugodacus cucurbitae]|uniref:Hypodermin-B n=1 Tax=Zeugodacus cucurbitae TaxID=28588 RepID=A0A0A1XMN9_ZEUCU|nr:trypsin delta [Zeugodacus cucurbitae]
MLRHITLVALFAIACFGGRAIAGSNSLLDNGRIVGGTDADIRQYPHQISLRYRGRHFCGGSIYSANIIVTATHCVDDEDPTDISIVAGVSTLDGEGVNIPVVKIIAHEKYNVLNDYDVALLLLATNLTFNESIQPIALAKERPPAGTEVTVTGWGRLVEGGPLSNRLQQVTVNLVGQSDCRKSYLLFLTKRMLCAGVVGGGQDSCQGDSGGPLIVGNELLGIVSWGAGCGSKNFPGVYASVPDLAEWIEATCDILTNSGNSGGAESERYSYL